MSNHQRIHRLLCEPFPILSHEVKPGAGGGQNGTVLALPFVPWHHYQARLDRVVGWENWGVSYKFLDEETVYCELSLFGITKGDCGEVEDEEGQGGQPQKRRGANPLFGGVAQAFRRASAAFGLGRYLYDLDRYYAKAENKRISEKAADIVYSLLKAKGLDPVTRYLRQISETSALAELLEVGDAIRAAAGALDLYAPDLTLLKTAYSERQAYFTKKAGGGSGAPPSSSSPPASSPAPSSTSATSSATAAPFDPLSSTPTAKEIGLLTQIEQCSLAAVMLQRNIRFAMDAGVKQDELTTPGMNRLIKAFNLKFPKFREDIAAYFERQAEIKRAAEQEEKDRAAEERASEKRPALRPTSQGMRPEDYDKLEAEKTTAKEETTEAREERYSKLIREGDLELLPALEGQAKSDRKLTSAGLNRLLKTINLRREELSKPAGAPIGSKLAEAMAKPGYSVQSHPPKKSQAVVAVEEKLKALTDVLELDRLLQEVSTDPALTTKDLDYLDPLFLERRVAFGPKRHAELSHAPMF